MGINMRKKAFTAILISNVIFGFSFMFSKIALELTIPSVLLAVRFLIAFALLNLVILLSKVIARTTGKELFRFELRGKPLKMVLLMGILHPGLYFICENYGIKYTSAAFSGTILAVSPVVGVLADVWIMHEKTTRRRMLCAVFSVAGVILTGLGGELRATFIGLLFLLVAVTSGTLYYSCSKLAASDYNAIERTYIMFIIGSVAFPILALIQTRGQMDALLWQPLARGEFWMAVVYLAGASSVIAFLLQNYGNPHLPISEITQIGNVTTVVSVLAGVLLLKEKFSPLQFCGTVIILICVYLVGRQAKSA